MAGPGLAGGPPAGSGRKTLLNLEKLFPAQAWRAGRRPGSGAPALKNKKNKKIREMKKINEINNKYNMGNVTFALRNLKLMFTDKAVFIQGMRKIPCPALNKKMTLSDSALPYQGCV